MQTTSEKSTGGATGDPIDGATSKLIDGATEGRPTVGATGDQKDAATAKLIEGVTGTIGKSNYGATGRPTDRITVGSPGGAAQGEQRNDSSPDVCPPTPSTVNTDQTCAHCDHIRFNTELLTPYSHQHSSSYQRPAPSVVTSHSDDNLLSATRDLQLAPAKTPSTRLKCDKATMTEYTSLSHRARIDREHATKKDAKYTDDKERFHWYDHRACIFGWGQLLCGVSLVIIDTIIVAGGYVHHDSDNIAFYVWESVFCFLAGAAGFVVKKWKDSWIIGLCMAQFTISAVILGVFFTWTCLILNRFDDGPNPVHLSFVILEVAVIWLRDITLLMSVVVSALQTLMTLRYLWRKHNWEQKIPENHRKSIRKYSRRLKRMMTV